MQTFGFSNDKLHLTFLVDDSKKVGLIDFSTKPFDSDLPEKYNPSSCLTEVKLTGSDINHMGSKMVGTFALDPLLYESHEETVTTEGKLLAVTLKNKHLVVTQYYQLYSGLNTLRAWCEVKNASDKNAGLEYVSSFVLLGLGRTGMDAAKNLLLYTPHNMWCEELNWTCQTFFEAGYTPIKQQTTKRLGYSSTGAWSTKEYLPMGAVADRETKRTLLWQIEHNGSWHWEICDVSGSQLALRISGPNEHENGWFKELSPNESFKSVTIAVALSDDGFGDAVRSMTEYRRKITAHIQDKDLPVIFNDYMCCLWANPTTEKELPVIKKAAEAGAEYYVMDAGWYSVGNWWPLVGEWKVCPERFPNGIKEVFDCVREHGMKPGIWLEPETMGIDCPLVTQFEDCFIKRHGRNVVDHGRYQFDFRKQKTLDHLNAIIDHFVDDIGIEFFKFDYNIDCGVGTEVDSDSFGDGLMQCNKAFLDWIDSLYVRHPGLKIENCSSGGMRMEYGSLQHFCIQSVSDSSIYNEFAYMSVMAPTAVIPEQTGIWVVPLPTQTDGQNVFAAVNAMLYRFYLSGKTHELQGEHFDLIKEAVAVYKSIRHDLIGSATYFPLGLCRFMDDWSIAARVSGDKRTLYVTAGRLSGDETVKIPLGEIPYAKKNAKIIYPSNFGNPEIDLKDNVLSVTLKETTAVLIKIELN